MTQEHKGSAPDEEGFEGIRDSNFNPYANVQPSLFWKGGKCKKNKCIGRVTIGTDFVVEFTMTIHGKPGQGWQSILHVGHSNDERSPGFWFHPKEHKLHVRLSDVYDKNKGYDPNIILEQNGTYHIKFECIDSTVALYIDNKQKSSTSDVVHMTRFLAPVWCGDPWYDAADASVHNLRIHAPTQSVRATPFNPEWNIINVLAIDHQHGVKENGKYFHFDKNEIESYLQRTLQVEERFKVRILRTNYVGSVIIWNTSNGGSKGTAHGRFDKDPVGVGIGYFKIGDKIEIIQRI